MSCKLFALLGAAMIWSGTATAGAPPAAAVLPHYDVQAHCKKIAGFGGSYSEDMFNTCTDQEQQAYDALKPVWGGLPDTMRKHCDQIARFGSASYDMLKTCIDQEQDAKKNTKGFKY
jgi:hypothetical protein